MPTHTPYTPTSSLPANSNGDRTILEAHLDSNLARLMDQIEVVARAALSQGGTLDPGTVTVESSTQVRVQDRVGIALDARVALLIGDQMVDLAGEADGVKYTVVISPGSEEFVEYAFTDPDTGESLVHSLVSPYGLLTYLVGDASNYPAVPSNAVGVAQVSKAAGVVTIDAALDGPPLPKALGGASAARPAAPVLGTSYFDSGLGTPRPIWWNGAAWVDATGTAV